MRDIFTPSLIWDLALIAVILFVMIRSVGRGFVSSFIHLLGLAAACIVAALLSGKAAAWLYDGYLAERLQTAVSDTLRQKLQTFAELLDRIDPTDTITGAAGDALRTVMVALLTMVAFLIIFLVAMVIVRALAKLTRNVNRVPVVGGVNRVLGGVLGAAEAFLLCYLIGMVAAVLITFSENEWSWLNTAVVQKSTILNWFVQFEFPVQILPGNGHNNKSDFMLESVRTRFATVKIMGWQGNGPLTGLCPLKMD